MERYKELVYEYKDEEGWWSARRKAKNQRINELIVELETPELHNIELKLHNIVKILKLMQTDK